MKTVVRVYISNTYDENCQATIDEHLTKEQLLAENADYESFAELVWGDCERLGYYDDSDRGSGVICMYFRGTLV